MSGFEYTHNGPNEPAPQQKCEAEFVQALQLQHSTVVDELICTHLLWMPEIFYPMVDTMGVIRTIVRLKDKRECDVVTSSVTGQTTISAWRYQL